jgi:F-type H+-transporting ATPase subunit b
MLFGFVLSVLASPESGGGGLLDVNPGVAIWTVLTFIVLVIVLKMIAWKPILAALAQREEAIKESLEKADKAKEEAQKLLDENQANMAKAGEEAKAIIEQSRQFAEKLKEQMMQESKQQAQKIIEDASAEIDRKKEAAFNELRGHVADIAITAAEKILQENLDKEKQKKVVDKYISEITKN